MDDLLHCPICGNKLRNSHFKNKYLQPINKTADYTERICATGHSHVLSLWANKKTNKIELLKISLNTKYSRFIEIDLHHQTCRIILANNGEYEYINVPYLLEPDFPDLQELKEKVNLYILLS